MPPPQVRYRVPPDAAAAAESDNPVSVLLRGSESSPAARRQRTARQHPRTPAPLRADLAALLRVPALLIYLQVTDAAAFFARLAKLAGQEGFPAGRRQRRTPGHRRHIARPADPSWSPGALGSGIQSCASCGKALEVVRSLPLVPGVGCRVSYELLRRMVALDLVVSYQEEGNIRPLHPGSTIS